MYLDDEEEIIMLVAETDQLIGGLNVRDGGVCA
jgi:hypothetical protein